MFLNNHNILYFILEILTFFRRWSYNSYTLFSSTRSSVKFVKPQVLSFVTRDRYQSTQVFLGICWERNIHRGQRLENRSRDGSHKESKSIQASLWDFPEIFHTKDYIAYGFLSKSLRFLFDIHKHLTKVWDFWLAEFFHLNFKIHRLVLIFIKIFVRFESISQHCKIFHKKTFSEIQ